MSICTFMDRGHHLIVLNQFNAPVMKVYIYYHCIVLITGSVKIDPA